MTKVTQITYDSSLEEPRPRIYCHLCNPSEDRTKKDVPFYLDTGSAYCGIVSQIVDELNLPPRGLRTLHISGRDDIRETYILEIQMEGIEHTHSQQVVVHSSNIVGLDILNQYSLRLDGPSRTGEIERK